MKDLIINVIKSRKEVTFYILKHTIEAEEYEIEMALERLMQDGIVICYRYEGNPNNFFRLS